MLPVLVYFFYWTIQVWKDTGAADYTHTMRMNVIASACTNLGISHYINREVILSKIVSIGTAVPGFRHEQSSILQFMQRVYAFNEGDRRKLKFLYHHSGIDTRYSVIPDYSRPVSEWKFYPQAENLDPFPSLEQRMVYYQRYAAPLSVDAIRDCLDGKIRDQRNYTSYYGSCTGMSAPGLDLQVMELLDLPKTIYRTSINFMGCYAAIHALKMADAICNSSAISQCIDCLHGIMHSAFSTGCHDR